MIQQRDLVFLLIGMVLGIMTKSLTPHIRNKLDGGHRSIPTPSMRHVLGVLFISMMLWTLWSTNLTQNEIKAVQLREQDCYSQFYQAITTNRGLNEDIAKIEDALDRLTAADQKALRDYVVQIANFPGDIAKLAPGDPAREQYKRDKLFEYIGKLEAVDTRRQKLSLDRADLENKRQPYPEPKCGKA